MKRSAIVVGAGIVGLATAMELVFCMAHRKEDRAGVVSSSPGCHRQYIVRVFG